MKDYHFEKDESRFDETIRLDEINEKVKELKNTNMDDELGDANAFLDAFESEKFDLPEEVFPVMEETVSVPEEESRTIEPPVRQWRQEEELGDTRKPEPVKATVSEEEEENDGMSKRMIGLLALAGVIACILGFAFVRIGSQPAMPPEEIASQAYPMLVESIVDGDEIVVYDIFSDIRKTILFTEETAITDAQGREVAFGSASVGDLMLTELAEDGKTARSIDYSSAAIQMREVSGLEVNTATYTLSSEDDSFTYGEQAIFLYEGEKIQPAAIASTDRLRLKGHEDVVWSVEVLEYHGYIAVENGENIKNGTFQLDEKEAVPLETVSRIPVTAGSHTITVTGENIETRKDTVTVQEGEELKYDLSKAQEKVGVIIVDANVSEYKLYINGALSESPAVLPMGEYDLVILKNGYLEWNEHVTLEGDSLTVHAELEKEFQYGTLTVTANCDGAVVYVNGEASGVAPMQVNLPYGSYMVRVEKEGHQPFEQTIQMNDAAASLYAELRQ